MRSSPAAACWPHHDIGENFLQVEIADGVQIKIQKQSVGSLMPRHLQGNF